MLVEFHKEVTDDAIIEMSDVMRREEKADFDAAFDSVLDGLIQCTRVTTNYDLGMVTVDGKLLAIYGCAVGWLDDCGNPWLVLAEDSEMFALPIIRHCRRIVQEWASEFKLLCNFVPAEDEAAIKMLQMIGFQFLNEQVEEEGFVRLPFYMVGGKA